MKRRQEEQGGSRPNSKRQEVAQEDRPPNTAGLNYLQSVKKAFKDNGGVYNEFMKLMQAYKRQSVTVPEVVAKVKDLFRDHHDLIFGFNTFLPEDYKIKVERPLDFGQAIIYARKIKATLQRDGWWSYQEFLKILMEYRNGTRSRRDVCEEVSHHLRNYPDLLAEFMCFLPENETAHYFRHAKALPDTPPQAEMAYKREMEDEFCDDKSSSEESDDPSYLPCIAIESDQGHGKTLETEEHRDIREQEQLVWFQELDRDEHTHLPSKGKCTKRGADNFCQMGEHSGEGNETLAGSSSPMPLFNGGILNSVQQKVTNMLQKSPELAAGFNQLVSHSETSELALLSLKEQEDLRERSGKRDSDKRTGYAEPEKYVEQERECKKHFSRDMEQEKESRKHFSRDAEQEKETKKHISRSVLTQKSSHPTNSSQCLKPVSELDLSKCKQCTPSYRLLPDNYPLPDVGFRTQLGDAVLNDTWVSVTSGSEDFKHMRKNQYEEILFRCEDDRFELDMLLKSTEATIKRLEELLEKVKESEIKEDFQIDDHLTAIQLRCIERIYGDHGLNVIDQLRQDVGVALPIVLNRLRQKHDEWLKSQADMNKVWAEVFAKNYHKSLDNRSFHFKEKEAKTLSRKALLSEIKELNAMNRKSDGLIISLASGNARPIIPDMELEYLDAGVNEALYQILKHSVKGVCSNVEQIAKVMRVWKIFLEPMFSPCHGVQETEKISKCKSVRFQNIVTSINDTTRHGERTLTDVEMHTVMPTMNDEIEASKQDVSKACALHTRETQQDAGKQCNGLRIDSNIAFLMTNFMSMGHGIDDTDQLQHPEREEREEGEIIPSQDTDEKFMEIHSSCTPSAEVGLCEGVTEHCQRYHTAKGGREVEHKDENRHTAKGFYDNEKAVTRRTSEGSGNGESEAGGEGVSCLKSGNADDLCANNEDEQQRLKTGGVEETADSGDNSLVNEERLMQRCSPLFPIGNPSVSVGCAPEDSVLFYGNDNMYILLRLHQALHERIHVAKDYAVAAERKLRKTKDGASPTFYHKFLRALYGFVDRTADSAEFEDICRSIGGNESYLFLTLDKLIFKLVKQLQVVASDEMATKLLALHGYEQSHAPHGPLDAVYHANASVLSHDENVYRFERRVKTGQLFIQLMEGCVEGGEAFSNALHSTFAKSLSNFFLLKPLEKSEKDPLFLKRNMLTYAVDDEQTEVSKKVYIANGLELKLSCKTYKVSYILGTEDVFHRRKCTVKADKVVSKAALKFHKWLDGHNLDSVASG